ncbi:MarR family winged helix-turn-helix transcriptional regulator [Hwanghaeella sp.]|uniref:MarR family winged helix-turn-helix transcriptional regulator n=1 Tax=Hwanghaeella sp. TaxID=2605943 RepID=UPI003CCBBE10
MARPRTAAGRVRSDEDALWRSGDVSLRPGFLIRRLHQIHTGLFLEACGDENITPVMYSVLSCLSQHGPLDQTTLAKEVAIDKTNMTDILKRLMNRGYVIREIADTDRRMRVTSLTKAGEAVLKRTDPLARDAHRKTLDALSPQDRIRFTEMMMTIVQAAETDAA